MGKMTDEDSNDCHGAHRGIVTDHCSVTILHSETRWHRPHSADRIVSGWMLRDRQLLRGATQGHSCGNAKDAACPSEWFAIDNFCEKIG
jgi:hypothetical protein